MTKDKRILLVDDDALFRGVVKSCIEKLNMKVFEAENGLIALEFLHSNEVDLILSDVNMPEMTGFELSRAMRDQGIRTPIILITGNPDYTKADAVQCGARDLMNKFFKTDELITVIQNNVVSF
ncbi:MAG: response regulator [Xanthomonadaceae bacterium]|nr:response regulator [Xanthomonadaceae bacterium]